jgi:GNAT superfamily N-acetyltransferase
VSDRAREAEIAALAHANLDDAATLLWRFFREEGFTTPRPLIVRNLGQMIDDGSCWGALALRDAHPVGVVTVTTMLYVEWGRLGEIGDLYVLPEHRRRGIARQLVEAAMLWCRDVNCSAVQVTITPQGEETHRLSQLYARLQFSPTGRTIMTAALPP